MKFNVLKHGAKCTLLLVSLGFGLGASAEPVSVTAPQHQSPERVLMVGNSYLYYGDSVASHVRRMVVADEPSLDQKLQFKSATIGATRLAHRNVDHLTKPGQIGVKKPFDVVILQGASSEPLSEKRRVEFREAVIAHDRIIRERGGRTALYMTPAYVKPHKRVSPENIQLTESLYTSVGNEIGALVIPVGLAFEEAYRRRPEIKLHKDFDGSHPDLAGTYLAAATVYASLYGRSPMGNRYDYFGKLDRDTVDFLQQVAHDTVQAFYRR